MWGPEQKPVHLLETIMSVRKLVNGSPALLDSLVVSNDVDRAKLAPAYATGFCTILLDEPPQAVNVIIGGTASTKDSSMKTPPKNGVTQSDNDSQCAQTR